jgi:hypothetical protein
MTYPMITKAAPVPEVPVAISFAFPGPADERLRIARDLHGDLGTRISHISLLRAGL